MDKGGGISLSARLGSNQSDIHTQNRALILKMIATEPHISRIDIARRTGLTKTTASKIVSDLMAEGMICESKHSSTENSLGRKPIYLGISPNSPCVCGLLVKRNLCSAILADFSGNILIREEYPYSHRITADDLFGILFALYERICKANTRRIISIGIAAIGPLDTVQQRLAKPPNFYGISDLPLASIFQERTGLPTYLINDANAGALAEKVYGGGRDQENFVYLHIMNGIGAGYVLHNQIYSGDTGQSGEIGHTSINFAGPVCDCGNLGCLEMYANLDAINRKVKHLQGVLGLRSVLDIRASKYTWREIIDAATQKDAYALSALDEFCMYISHALANAVNLLDIGHIVVGYDSGSQEDTLATILARNLTPRVLMAKSHQVTVTKSVFGGDAPLIGSIALVTNKYFTNELPI